MNNYGCVIINGEKRGIRDFHTIFVTVHALVRFYPPLLPAIVFFKKILK